VDRAGHFLSDVHYRNGPFSIRYAKDASWEDLRYAGAGDGGEPALAGGERGTYRYDPARLLLIVNINARWDPSSKSWVRTGDKVMETLSTQSFVGTEGFADVYTDNVTEWVSTRIFSRFEAEPEQRLMKVVTRESFTLSEGGNGYRSTVIEQTAVANEDPRTTAMSERVADARFTSGTPDLPDGQTVRVELSNLISWQQDLDPATSRLGKPAFHPAAADATMELTLIRLGRFVVSLAPGTLP
jgi:hypothetical protein